jgi:putative ABC transport system permease protein
MNTIKLVVRVSGDPTALVAGVRESIWAIDKDQPIGDIKTMNQVIEAKAAGDRFLGWMLAGFASTGLGLATIGIFGVVAYTVAQRTHEIGVRMAFGAQKGNIFLLIVGRGILLATTGTAVGLIGAVFVVRILASPAYSDSWFSALLILIVAPASVILTALLASYIPARRASRVDPMIALRYE